MTAEFKDGILTLTLPKINEARRKVVKVNLADKTLRRPEPRVSPLLKPTTLKRASAEPATV